ncbi:SRPBCC family protein [Tenacibaculum insulae]|uniref:SRPBCC family protein n=1 Tax=Tenacibaculum insulae TaxID=2029677 RepID=UPI003AB35FD6
MKAVKIILGIVIALTVVFLATGLVVKEVKYTTEIEINKPINEVFALFENPKTIKEWMPEIKSIETIEEKATKIGSTYKMVVENQGQEITMIEKITAYKINQKITFQFDSNQMLKTDDFNFSSNGSTTKIVQHSSVEAKGYLMGCMFPYFKSTLKDLSLGYMKDFKKIAEK